MSAEDCKLKLIETAANKTLSTNHLFDVSSIDELQKEVQRIVNNLDLSDSTFTWLPKRHLSSVGIFQSIPHQVYIDYLKKGYDKHDALIQHCKNRDTPVFITNVYNVAKGHSFHLDALQVNKDNYEYLANFGFLDFYSIPAPSYNGVDKVMLSVTAKDLPPDQFSNLIKKHEKMLRLLVQVIDYLWWSRWPNERTLKSVEQFNQIPPQALRVLETLANGDLTLKQVAEELNMAVSTVNNHISTAKKVLGTKTIYKAIRKAVNLGVIDYKDD